jgi:hypothetical protein
MNYFNTLKNPPENEENISVNPLSEACKIKINQKIETHSMYISYLII